MLRAWHSLSSSSSSLVSPPQPFPDVPRPVKRVDLLVISRFPHLVLVSGSQDEVLQLSPFLPPPGDPGRITGD